MAEIRRGRARAVAAISTIIAVGALAGVVGQVWGSALRGRARPAAPAPGPGVTPFVRGLQDVIHLAYLPGYHLPVTETLGAWELTFHGENAEEAKNVELCVRALDGAVIPAGAVFSFNETVGERTAERGFRPGLMYVAGQVVTGMGGGVCIPSTALYNAALNADMEILERHNHSGPVSYATPGLDAAVVYGMKDLRFRNTSHAPAVIHADVLGNILSIGISGKPVPGRRVVVERTDYMPLAYTETTTADPTALEGAPTVAREGRAGWNATVVRSVYQGKKLLRRETVSHDTVAPRARIILVNPLDMPDSPEAAAAEAARADIEPAIASEKTIAAPPASAPASKEQAESPRVEEAPVIGDGKPGPRIPETKAKPTSTDDEKPAEAPKGAASHEPIIPAHPDS